MEPSGPWDRDRVAFEMSTNDPPYGRVRGRGRAAVSPDAEQLLLRALLERYLGGVDNPTGKRLLRPEREEVRIRSNRSGSTRGTTRRGWSANR